MGQRCRLKVGDGAKPFSRLAYVEGETSRGAIEHSPRQWLQNNLMLLAAMKDLTTEELYLYAEACPVWEPGLSFLQGQYLYNQQDDLIYQCLQTLDTREDLPPGVSGAEALYSVVPRPSQGTDVLPWVVNEEVHPGDLRMYNGVVYERLSPWYAGTNIWEPSSVPAVWRALSA